MKLFSIVLISLFALVGAHVPKAFSLLYLALVISWLMSCCLDPRPLPYLPAIRRKLLRIAQVLVLLFSCTYPIAMLHFGFWQLSGRQLLDVVSAVILPTSLLWWGAYWARRGLPLFVACLLSYSFGGLVFLLAALFKTWGLSWFVPHADPETLLMAWGSEVSMNVRSIEQNGILNVVLAPVSLWLLLERRYWMGWLLLLVALVGWLAVLPLAHGRLWIVSLALASWPLVCLISKLVPHFISSDHWLRWLPKAVSLMAAVLLVSLLWSRRAVFCDERLGMFAQALHHWPVLMAGGRLLTYKTTLCDGQTSVLVSLQGGESAGIAMLHNVPLDVVATVGFWAALPMLSLLFLALYCCGQFLLFWLRPVATNQKLQCLWLLWCFLSAAVPQWLFQPLIYGDGLLYYLSYASFGALLVISGSKANTECATVPASFSS
jgi:hypothetical protein